MTTSLFDLLTAERGQFCEVCHSRLATDVHHCLYHRDRRHKELDCAENCELVCRTCHQDGRVNSYQHRVEFYISQCCRYGSRWMEEWNDGLPLKNKARFV